MNSSELVLISQNKTNLARLKNLMPKGDVSFFFNIILTAEMYMLYP